METQILFKSDNIMLEGLLCRVPGHKAAIVTHPHSLYGGDMNNHIVGAICQVFANKGYTTLRFNFRGVGRSEGEFDNGCGEGRDVLGAIEYLLGACIESIYLAGYSFGSRVLAGITTPPEVKAQIYISPPVAFMDFSKITSVKELQSVVTGEVDEIAPAEEIETYLSQWNSAAKLHVINGGDHSFSNVMERFNEVLDEIIP